MWRSLLLVIADAEFQAGWSQAKKEKKRRKITTWTENDDVKAAQALIVAGRGGRQIEMPGPAKRFSYRLNGCA
jgi:hypothetical protein